MKRSLSMLLALCMFLGVITPVLASSEIRLAAPAAEVHPAAEENFTEESYVQGVVLFALDNADRFAAIADLLSAFGVSEVEPLFTENGAAVGFGERNEVWYRASVKGDVGAAVNGIANLDGVICAEPEYIYTSDNYGSPTEIEMSKDWAYKKLHKHENKYWWKEHFNHDEAPGFGTVVAVIDTGVDYTHEDLASSMWVNVAEMYGAPGVDDDGNGYIDDIHGVDVTADGKKAGNPMDDHGHGTHVAGIIAMSSNGVGGVGLAYGAKIMAIKAGMSTGSLASTDIAKAINYAHMMGADVINMSFGGSGKSYLIEQALEEAFGDCVLVAAAGNDGLPTTDAPTPPYMKKVDIYPAGYTYVLGVMASDEKGELAGFSNWDYIIGQNCEYELTAPGVGIHSTLPGNRYAEWNGTSMAAPFVAAAAAILRSHYSDKDMYSSRFIMGQLSAATKDRTAFTAPKGEHYSYPALNVYDSVFYLPTPDIFVKDTFLMDNVMAGTPNDGDAIIDVGEVVDLGILIRNRWGLTGNITVRADAISEGGVANPYITFLTDTVTLAPAGTFQEVNNGFVYDDSYLTAVSNPIRFAVAQNTPNDTEICINITVTTTNGADEEDDDIYTAGAEYTFRVQNGRGIKGTIYEDMTLTNDYLWIVENTVLIPEGVTLTVEPGTKIQFYSSDYEDAYGGLVVSEIVNRGTLNFIGTEAHPIEMTLGAGYEYLSVRIVGNGIERLQYCNVYNPILGNFHEGSASIELIDHCSFIQNTNYPTWRRIYNGKVIESGIYHGYVSDDNAIIADKISNSKFYNLSDIRGDGGARLKIDASIIESCLFNEGSIYFHSLKSHTNNVFLKGSKQDDTTLLSPRSYIYLDRITKIDEDILFSEDEGKKYLIVDDVENEVAPGYEIIKDYAASIGGTLLCINNANEEQFILDALYKNQELNRSENDTGQQQYDYYLGYEYSGEDIDSYWADSNDYQISFVNPTDKTYYRYGYIRLYSSNSEYIHEYRFGGGYWGQNVKYIIEFSSELSDDEIIQAIANFDVMDRARTTYPALNTNNAILNPVLDLTPDRWTRVVAINNIATNFSNNYWGTENEMLINKMIIDADDFPGTYQDIIHEPILTLESESLADIYPFVTKVYMTDSDGNIVANVTPGEEYDVHVLFNRDMDMDTQPSISYGGETPYTDYTVNGAFVSSREWVGTTKISPILNSGTMYFRTKGGCAADDKWLVCGEDTLRFSFNVTTTGVLAMMLNAEGGTNKVELSWAQNDYDTLAGYNIYRSTAPDGYFEKVNVSIVTGTEYTDTDVQPGVTYYYYFKVVNTEGNEEENVSNTASAAPIDSIFPELQHNTVSSAKANAQITISATATDNITVAAVNLYYRKAGETSYQMKAMTAASTPNLYVATIPAAAVTGAGVEYFVTATDGDGNTAHSGTALVPHKIQVNSAPYISGITPSKISIEGGKTIAILGGNFSEGMTLKLGAETITEFSLINDGQIQFVAPAMTAGTYAIVLTSATGETALSPTPLSYTDASAIVQIPTNMTMASGEPYAIPLYATAAGDIVSLHVDVHLSSLYYTDVRVELADKESSTRLEQNYDGSVLRIGCINSVSLNTGDQPLLYIYVTPRVLSVTEVTVLLADVSINGGAVHTVISGEAVLKPSYTIRAWAKYFAGENNAVPGVTVSAAGTSGVTDGTGYATLIVSEQNVTVTAIGGTPANAVTSYDASLVLQSAVGSIALSEYQKLAADVDGNGAINEYDAALILQKAVKKLDVFPIGAAWILTPASQNVTLYDSVNEVVFIAVSVGDVDGSYRGGTN